MGNRAVIEFENVPGMGIYLHWNGGRDSVEAFLDVAKGYGIRDDCYGVARLAQIIGNYFGGTLSLGVGPIDTLDCDNGDNGTYVVSDWKIVDRKYFDGGREQREYDHNEMVADVKEPNDTVFGR